MRDDAAANQRGGYTDNARDLAGEVITQEDKVRRGYNVAHRYDVELAWYLNHGELASCRLHRVCPCVAHELVLIRSALAIAATTLDEMAIVRLHDARRSRCAPTTESLILAGVDRRSDSLRVEVKVIIHARDYAMLCALE